MVSGQQFRAPAKAANWTVDRRLRPLTQAGYSLWSVSGRCLSIAMECSGQRLPLPSTSPPARVANARQTVCVTSWLTGRTDPSINTTFTMPGW